VTIRRHLFSFTLLRFDPWSAPTLRRPTHASRTLFFPYLLADGSYPPFYHALRFGRTQVPFSSSRTPGFPLSLSRRGVGPRLIAFVFCGMATTGDASSLVRFFFRHPFCLLQCQNFLGWQPFSRWAPLVVQALSSHALECEGFVASLFTFPPFVPVRLRPLTLRARTSAVLPKGF